VITTYNHTKYCVVYAFCELKMLFTASKLCWLFYSSASKSSLDVQNEIPTYSTQDFLQLVCSLENKFSHYFHKSYIQFLTLQCYTNTSRHYLQQFKRCSH